MCPFLCDPTLNWPSLSYVLLISQTVSEQDPAGEIKNWWILNLHFNSFHLCNSGHISPPLGVQFLHQENKHNSIDHISLFGDLKEIIFYLCLAHTRFAVNICHRWWCYRCCQQQLWENLRITSSLRLHNFNYYKNLWRSFYLAHKGDMTDTHFLKAFPKPDTVVADSKFSAISTILILFHFNKCIKHWVSNSMISS